MHLKYCIYRGILQFQYRFSRNFFHHFWILGFIIVLVIVKIFVFSANYPEINYPKYLISGYCTWRAFSDPLLYCLKKMRAENLRVFAINTRMKERIFSYILSGSMMCIYPIMLALLYSITIGEVTNSRFLGFSSYIGLISAIGAFTGVSVGIFIRNIADIHPVVESCITVLFWISPILWVTPENGPLLILTNYNPFGYLLEIARMIF